MDGPLREIFHQSNKAAKSMFFIRSECFSGFMSAQSFVAVGFVSTSVKLCGFDGAANLKEVTVEWIRLGNCHSEIE